MCLNGRLRLFSYDLIFIIICFINFINFVIWINNNSKGREIG